MNRIRNQVSLELKHSDIDNDLKILRIKQASIVLDRILSTYNPNETVPSEDEADLKK